MTEQVLQVDRVASPIGDVLVMTDSGGRVRALNFSDTPEKKRRQLQRHYGAGLKLIEGRAPSNATQRIVDYFAGDLSALAEIEVETKGTPFQHQVWAALRSIPVGETISYGELAARIGKPTASRAVGMANNANPVPIIVPCHRVIGADGSMTGYGGGLDRKHWLLAHEGWHPQFPT